MNFIDRYKQDMEEQNEGEQKMDDTRDEEKEQLQNFIAQMLFKPQKDNAQLRAEVREELLQLTDVCIECGNKFYNAFRGKLPSKMIAEIFCTFIKTIMEVG